MLSISVSRGNASSNFGGNIDGNGQLLKIGSGTLTLSGISDLSGATLVNAGTLNVSGSLASSSVTVNNGASLTGSGALLGAANVASGGHLVLSSGNVLSVNSLSLASGSNLNVSLGAPSTTALASVVGNLALNGQLNVSDAGGFGVGLYRLINYSGSLSGSGLNVASVPVGFALGDLVVQTSAAN